MCFGAIESTLKTQQQGNAHSSCTGRAATVCTVTQRFGALLKPYKIKSSRQLVYFRLAKLSCGLQILFHFHAISSDKDSSTKKNQKKYQSGESNGLLRSLQSHSLFGDVLAFVPGVTFICKAGKMDSQYFLLPSRTDHYP